MIGANDRCYICGRTQDLQTHHIFNAANRNKSEKYGLTVRLCLECHTGSNGVHNNAQRNFILKRVGQIHYMFEQEKTKEMFIAEFGRNYLEDSEIESLYKLIHDKREARK